MGTIMNTGWNRTMVVNPKTRRRANSIRCEYAFEKDFKRLGTSK
jgi:hypothetical protein